MSTARMPVTWETVDHTAMHVLLSLPGRPVDAIGRPVVEQIRTEHAERFPDCTFTPQEAAS